jgi:hypothetical protein
MASANSLIALKETATFNLPSGALAAGADLSAVPQAVKFKAKHSNRKYRQIFFKGISLLFLCNANNSHLHLIIEYIMIKEMSNKNREKVGEQ